MRGYWLKIGFGAMLIFAVGFGLISAGKRVKASIESGTDIEIPLGSFIPFKLEGASVGTVRAITIHRSAPNVLSGFDVRLRTSDSATFAKLESCNLSVSDARNLDERTTFLCLPSDSGYQAFGDVTVDYRTEVDNRTLVRSLLLPQDIVGELQQGRGGTTAHQLADSIAREVRVRIRPLRAVYDDSVEAARLDQRSLTYSRRADSIRQRAESIRARSRAGSTSAPVTPVAPRPPSP